MNKGQMQQVFTFLFVAIVIVAILIVGGKSIGKLTNTGCSAQEDKLKNNIEEVLITYSTYGTKQKISLPAACNSDAICLFNNDATRNSLTSNNIPKNIQSQIQSTIEGNIFLVQDNTIKQIGNSNLVNTKQSETDTLLCIKNTGGLFNLRVEGQGRKILFSEAQ